MESSIPLVLGTANPGKLAEFRRLLPLPTWRLLGLADFPDVSAAEESGQSLAANARLKAAWYGARLGRWVLADDTGLEVDALDGAPGIHSARFAGPGATAEDNRRRLLAELAGVAMEHRTARYVCHLALADPSGQIRAESEGVLRGRIRLEPAGGRGFGYDSLFEIVEYRRSLAELGEVAQAYLTHRARAVAQIRPELDRLLA